MYVPAAFEENDLAILHALMRQFSFATLITTADAAPFATHLPFLVDAGEGGLGVLRAHLARANPQWRHFTGSAEALVIFQGPHSYISPGWYEGQPAVPTWNYAAVHAYGVPRLLDDAETLGLLRASVAEYDPAPEALDMPDEFVRRMQRGLVGFELPVARLEGKRKMSQNKSEADREGVIAALSASEREDGRAALSASCAGRRAGPENRCEGNLRRGYNVRGVPKTFYREGATSKCPSKTSHNTVHIINRGASFCAVRPWPGRAWPSRRC